MKKNISLLKLILSLLVLLVVVSCSKKKESFVGTGGRIEMLVIAELSNHAEGGLIAKKVVRVLIVSLRL